MRSSFCSSRLAAVLTSAIMSVGVVAPSVAHAESIDTDERAFLEKITYQDKTSESAPAELASPAMLWSLKRLGYTDVSENFAELLRETGGPGLVFKTPGFEKFFIIRFDLELKNQKLLGQTLKTPANHFLVHTKTGNHRAVAVYFDGFTQIELNPVLATLRQVSTAQRDSRPTTLYGLVASLILERAEAQDVSMRETARLIVAHPKAAAIDFGQIMYQECFVHELNSAVRALKISAAYKVLIRSAVALFGATAEVVLMTRAFSKAMVVTMNETQRSLGDKKVDDLATLHAACGAAAVVAIGAAVTSILAGAFAVAVSAEVMTQFQAIATLVKLGDFEKVAALDSAIIRQLGEAVAKLSKDAKSTTFQLITRTINAASSYDANYASNGTSSIR